MSKKTNKPKNEIVWTCPHCSENPQFNHLEMMAHLLDAHQIDPKTSKGSKQMTMHADSSEAAYSSYEWTINGLKFYQTVTTVRGNNDMMRHSEPEI